MVIKERPFTLQKIRKSLIIEFFELCAAQLNWRFVLRFYQMQINQHQTFILFSIYIDKYFEEIRIRLFVVWRGKVEKLCHFCLYLFL